MFSISSWQKLLILGILLLIFSSFFLRQIKSDLPLIFKKDLYAHDESVNSVVTANVVRKFFPPMIRTNPLVVKPGNWMEGPFWQHIPPLFAYVPLIPFLIDGKITIEVKRLSFAFLALLTGLIFISSVYLFEKKLPAAAAATLAAIFWIATPFSRELITGVAFGGSDILLAFAIVCSMASILWYLRQSKEARINYPGWQFILISLFISLPILAKSLLGAIPAATFFFLLLYDFHHLNKKLIYVFVSFFGLILLFFGSLYLSSPFTFKSEILVSFFHVGEYEGWGRPWYYFLTNYLPLRYLGNYTFLYYASIILGIFLIIFYRIKNKTRTLLILSLTWFLWNLLAISLVRSKVPSFIYQTYLLSLFFIIYGPVAFASDFFSAFKIKALIWLENKKRPFFYLTLFILTLTLGFFIHISYGLASDAKNYRSAFYSYNSDHEKFYQVAEHLQISKVSKQDLFIINTSNDDCWFRYDILFLTGAESKTLLELSFNENDYQSIKQKYRTLNFILNKEGFMPKVLPKYSIENFEKYSIIKFDLDKFQSPEINQIIKSFLEQNKELIQKQVELFKKDKSSCQWLIPDPILNSD